MFEKGIILPTSCYGHYYWFVFFFAHTAKGFYKPGDCKSGQYYEPGTLTCEDCPANASMITSADGFGCSCEEHSIPVSIKRCKPCNITEVVSTDGATCVPRKCQNISGRITCRKCPNDYITVTQNMDGSSLKEVQCVKCARGYKAENNVCTKCTSCVCNRNQVIVRDTCLPKSYVNKRPKYEENSIHPLSLLDVVKHEYLCTQNDVRACRILANECVRNFYSSDPAGPCRLWIQPNITIPKGLAKLVVDIKMNDKKPGEINVAGGKNALLLTAGVFTANGGIELLHNIGQQATSCLLPFQITIGADFSSDCSLNMSVIKPYLNSTLSPYLYLDNELIEVPVYPWKPNGYIVQKGSWPINKFRRYFLVDESLSTVANITNVIYLRTNIINIRIHRNSASPGSLKLHISMESHYAVKSGESDGTIISLRIIHDMPAAGVLRGLEIWGGILGSLLTLYAMAKWRGVIRRGGLYVSGVPLLAGSISDALYFAALLSTLHALAAEAGTLGITLPLARNEEYMIKAFLYSAVSLKVLKVAWFNFKQCRCDIFFLNWSEYTPPFRDSSMDKSNKWKASTLAREWNRMQTKRRVDLGYTVASALVILQLMTPWQSYIPQSRGYKWVIATIAWWTGYSIILAARYLSDKVLGSPAMVLSKICNGVGLSLLVFEEELYAHYVHGRNEDSKDLRLAGPLATCRVVCAPQLRTVYKQLSSTVPGLGEIETRQALLSRFLAAFFERALDGLSWVASERTTLERLLDVEITTREAGNTSTLLYDPDDHVPSCFAVTWWGEEWSLATFDAMVFGCLVISTDDLLTASLVTLIIWQVMKLVRGWFGMKNQKEKTDIQTY